ncbi:MAG TPA: hypothetical protein VGL11_09870 [Candidatus Binatia bacterium]
MKLALCPAKRGREQGFTLLELVLVSGIIVLFISLLVPLGRESSDQAGIVRAKTDTFAIATALSSFFSDLDHFPSCNGSDCATLNDAANNLRFLAFCRGAESCAATYPMAPSWNLEKNQERSPARNNAYNHLVVNSPPGPFAKGYREGQWKGPYLGNVGLDPYGKAYIVHIGAMEKKGCPAGSGGEPPFCFAPVRGAKGWILSAGPNGILDTAPNATVLAGDDIGMILFSR